jgi:peroxiredoxin-like protein
MQEFPHHYKIEAAARPEGDVSLSGDKLDAILSAPPVQFGGPGDRWSPESLLVASVADCFVLSFRAIARASKFSWESLQCEVEGTLERTGGSTKFTKFMVHATLHVPEDTNVERAHRLLVKAEESCLITNSLCAETHLDIEVLSLS